MKIRCPKCSHEQSGRVECEACGLIFARYREIQARRKERAAPRQESPDSPEAPPPERSGGFGRLLLGGLVLVALSAGLTWFVLRGHFSAPVAETPAAVPPAERAYAPLTPPGPPSSGEAREVPPALSESAIIQQAKNGTVAIETPWGKGSGFFVAPNLVVTNKHVVAPDRSQLNEIRHQVETARKLINLEREQIAELRGHLARMQDGPARQQLIIIIQEKEKNLNRVLPGQRESEERLARMERPASAGEIRIFLADGSQQAVHGLQASPSRDLALLTVHAHDPAVLRPVGGEWSLREGDRVYAIGNPVGLRHTVTSGIFSGYRRQTSDNEVYLQTDAPINPGNSGGPLIDEQGLVHGVNTMIIKNTQGIGFAIPIQTVLKEFPTIPR